MLKSTYKPAQQPTIEPLPPGWTEHKAPTGNSYYYNSETQQSTYTRPTTLQHWTPQLQPDLSQFPQPSSSESFAASFEPQHTYGAPSSRRHDKREQWDRPKSKHAVPGCAPWVLVKTKFGRRFVHNPDTNESFWKFPKDVIGGVIEFDIQERKKLEEPGDDDPMQAEIEAETTATAKSPHKSPDMEQKDLVAVDSQVPDYDSEEYEEVEVTDNEDDREGETSSRSKRQKTGQEGEDEMDEQDDINNPIEFTEEDMAFQLARMGESYDLDPGEYYDEEEAYEEGAEGLPFSDAEARESFKDLLNDHNVNPYTTWDAIIEEGRIIEDDRYTLLPNMKSRREVFADWSAHKIAQMKAARQSQTKQDPRINYLDLLARHASPKLYWQEFKRKFKKEPEMKDSKMQDKDREKLYRDHIARITKMTEGQLKEDLEQLLKSIPSNDEWNRDVTLAEGLPNQLLADVRYISLKPGVRDEIIHQFIKTLPPASEISNHLGEVPNGRSDEEQRKFDEAMKKRERQVFEDRKRQEKELTYGKGLMREEERELERATRVGKDGLKGSLS